MRITFPRTPDRRLLSVKTFLWVLFFSVFCLVAANISLVAVALAAADGAALAARPSSVPSLTLVFRLHISVQLPVFRHILLHVTHRWPAPPRWICRILDIFADMPCLFLAFIFSVAVFCISFCLCNLASAYFGASFLSSAFQGTMNPSAY